MGEVGIDPFTIFLDDIESGLQVPGIVFFNLMSTVIDEIRRNNYLQLPPPETYNQHQGTSANNYISEHYMVSKNVVGQVMDLIHKSANKCSGTQGYLTFHPFGSVTGSGVTSVSMKCLYVDYGEETKRNFAVCLAKHTATAGVEFSRFDFGHTYDVQTLCSCIHIV
ncbi:tubulin alpha [Paragonimus westermani]|uniref:Tubulin alpha n=1 Tax=Paragonimus westermani TaxID=34504 RepID=A0A5J4N420_9TREM|nr:tubulin alpha [Paragonimus westermani]